MNSRTTKRALNAAFKRFQRLPDWPFEKAMLNARRSEVSLEKGRSELPASPKTRSPKAVIAPLAPGFFGAASAKLSGSWVQGQNLVLAPQD